MLTELSSLDAVGIHTENASEAELAKLGLAPPNTIVSVFGAAPEAEQAEGAQDAEQAPAALPRLAEIHIGNVEGSESILARAAGDPVVYRLSYEFAEHLPVSLDALRNRFLAEAEPEPAAPPGEGEGELLDPSQESP
jgi:hypothetical protein